MVSNMFFDLGISFFLTGQFIMDYRENVKKYLTCKVLFFTSVVEFKVLQNRNVDVICVDIWSSFKLKRTCFATTIETNY